MDPLASASLSPPARTYVKVWLTLVALTLTLVVVSRAGPAAALGGLLLIAPLKAGLVFYYFMHLKDEGPLLRIVLLVALGTLLIFFGLLYSDIAFR
jgi:cytochrome c oxidase subunit 4